MGRRAQNGGHRTARNNNNSACRNTSGGGNRTNKLDVSALGLVSPLGGDPGRGALNAIGSTAGLQQQQTQLSGLLRGGTTLTGGVWNELDVLCALLGGSQSP